MNVIKLIILICINMYMCVYKKSEER